MPLLFNSLLHQVGVPVGEVRLLRHQDARSSKGRTPYELWRDDRPLFDIYQSQQGFANRGQLTAGAYWASFLGTPAGTLFAGLYRASYRGLLEADTPWPHGDGTALAGSCDVYDLNLDDRLADLAGRVVIEWGPGTRAWVQRADNQNKVVVEIRRTFTEPAFPGFAAFIEPLSRIEGLPASWITALRASRGVYLLTCPRTREQYVGSASGEDGFFGRWLAYVQTGHGGNVALKSRDPSDYQVSILEVAGSAATMPEVVAMEGRWKAKLQSMEMGLNRN